MQKAVDEFILAKAANGRATRTVEDYGRVLGSFGEWCAEQGVSADNLNRNAIRRYLIHLRSNGWAEATVAIHVRNLRTFLRWAHAEGTLSENFATIIECPRSTHREESPLTTEELGRIIAACQDDDLAARDRALIWTFVDTGLRIGEMARLNRDVLHFGDNDRAWMRIYAPKTRTYRFAILGKRTTRALVGYLKERGDDDLDALWMNRRGKRLAARGIYQVIKRRSRAAGLGRVHPHLFRKTFSTRWLDNGGDIERLRVLNGWSAETAAAMLTIYIESQVEDLKRAHIKAGPVDRLTL